MVATESERDREHELEDQRAQIANTKRRANRNKMERISALDEVRRSAVIAELKHERRIDELERSAPLAVDELEEAKKVAEEELEKTKRNHEEEVARIAAELEDRKELEEICCTVAVKDVQHGKRGGCR